MAMVNPRFYSSDRIGRSSLPHTPSSSGSPLSPAPSETPSSHSAMASNISLFQEQMTTMLKKLEETNEKLETLTQRIENIENTNAASDVVGEVNQKGKRKRTKDSLTVQVILYY